MSDDNPATPSIYGDGHEIYCFDDGTRQCIKCHETHELALIASCRGESRADLRTKIEVMRAQIIELKDIQ